MGARGELVIALRYVRERSVGGNLDVPEVAGIGSERMVQSGHTTRRSLCSRAHAAGHITSINFHLHELYHRFIFICRYISTVEKLESMSIQSQHMYVPSARVRNHLSFAEVGHGHEICTVSKCSKLGIRQLYYLCRKEV